MRRVLRSRSLPAFALLFGSLYGAYGTESPFLPSFLGERGLTPEDIGVLLAVGTAVRLAAGPMAGRVADKSGSIRLVLGCAAAGSGIVSFGYLAGHGFWSLLAISTLHSIFIAALAPLADALALAAASREGTFRYGWVRGIGSGAFILGTIASGQLVGSFGLSSIIVSSGCLFLVMAAAPGLVPNTSRPVSEDDPPGGFREVLAVPAFRRVLFVAALVLGSHSVNDSFTVIHWRAAGLSSTTVSLLWSESVAAEVVMFVLLGPPLLARLGPGRAAALAAGVGIARWAIMASTTAAPVLAFSQLGHGFTFALLHLANMNLITGTIPSRLAATAQTLYGTVALGLTSIVLTLASGALYGRFGAGAFWFMAGLCVLALPLTAKLSTARVEGSRRP